MSELSKVAPTQAEMDKLLDPAYMSGKQLEILLKMDEKNVDRADLRLVLAAFIETYEQVVRGQGES